MFVAKQRSYLQLIIKVLLHREPNILELSIVYVNNGSDVLYMVKLRVCTINCTWVLLVLALIIIMFADQSFMMNITCT